MGSQATNQGGMPVGPTSGDVRFNDAGSLETFDGTEWVPLERLTDVGAPPVFRHEHMAQPSTQEEIDDAP
jgi:hypothetical protein